MTIHPQLRQAFARKNALKVISGLNNFDNARVATIVKAAAAGGATFVDIAADSALVHDIRQITDLPICVSAVEPNLFVDAVKAGADLIEIGNFDSFFDRSQNTRMNGVSTRTTFCLNNISPSFN